MRPTDSLIPLERIDSTSKNGHSTQSSCCERGYHVTVSDPGALLLTALTQNLPGNRLTSLIFRREMFIFFFLLFLTHSLSFPFSSWSHQPLFLSPYFSACFLLLIFLERAFENTNKCHHPNFILPFLKNVRFIRSSYFQAFFLCPVTPSQKHFPLANVNIQKYIVADMLQPRNLTNKQIAYLGKGTCQLMNNLNISVLLIIFVLSHPLNHTWYFSFPLTFFISSILFSLIFSTNYWIPSIFIVPAYSCLQCHRK